VSKTKKKASTAIAVPTGFSKVADVSQERAEEFQSTNMPWIGFQAKAGDTAMKVVKAIDGIETGHPFVSLPGDNFLPLKGAKLFVLPDLTLDYYIEYSKGSSSKKANAYFKDEPRALMDQIRETKDRSRYVTEAVEAVTVILLPDNDLGLDSVVAMTRFEGAKRRFATGLRTAVANTLKPEWAKLNGFHQAMIDGGVPAGYRVAGKIKIVPKTSRATGETYYTAYAETETPTGEDLDRLVAVNLDDALTAFNKRTGWVKKQF